MWLEILFKCVRLRSVHPWLVHHRSRTMSCSSHAEQPGAAPPADNQRKSAQEENMQFFVFFIVSLERYAMKAAAPVTLTNLIISALQAV